MIKTALMIEIMKIINMVNWYWPEWAISFLGTHSGGGVKGCCVGR
jgi:hypothetical protein